VCQALEARRADLDLAENLTGVDAMLVGRRTRAFTGLTRTQRSE
jgi:hypothetical protein